MPGLRRAVPLVVIAAATLTAGMLAAHAHAAADSIVNPTLVSELSQAYVVVNATATPAQSRYGQPVTVTGNVTYQPETTPAPPPQPLAGAALKVLDTDRNDTTVATLTTDASGNFSLRLPTRPTGQWAIDLTYDEMTLINDGGSTDLTTTVSVPTTITGFSMRRAADGHFTARACVTPTIAVPGVTMDVFDVENDLMRFQEAASPRGPWRDMWNGGDTSFGTCDHGGLQVDTCRPSRSPTATTGSST